MALSHIGVWWRGQPRIQDWPLLPKVFRGGFASNENTLAILFRDQAPVRYPNCPSDERDPTWLFLMQHYGLPTRLLDWTQAPLIAAYFAVREEDYVKDDGVIWGLCPAQLNRNQFELQEDKIFTTHGVRTLFPPVLLPEPKEGQEKPDPNESQEKIAAMTPKQIDIRMLVQLSCFTIHSTLHPLEMIDGADKFLIKIIIPSSIKQLLKGFLALLGITESSIFPDLDHLASDLASKRPFEPRKTSGSSGP